MCYQVKMHPDITVVLRSEGHIIVYDNVVAGSDPGHPDALNHCQYTLITIRVVGDVLNHSLEKPAYESAVHVDRKPPAQTPMGIISLMNEKLSIYTSQA